MPALTEWQPLKQETIDTIRARFDGNVNAGLDPTDVRWQETVGGGFFYDHTQSFGLEAELLWDYASTELPASFFLPFSWGIYLDYWGQLLDVARNPAVPSTGTVTLTNTTDEDILAGAGLGVSAPAVDTTSDELAFLTIATVTVPADGSIDVAVEADSDGSDHNVASGAVTLVRSPVSGLTVTNADAITGGADEELDEDYKARLLLEFSGARGGGTQDDYIAETLEEFPEVGAVIVEPFWSGPNTVRLVIADVDHHPLSGTVVDEVQAFWDPIGSEGLGLGEAPLCAEVTVATVTVVDVDVVATVELEPGYTLDGALATTAVQGTITDALLEYFNSLGAGRDVQRNRIIAAINSVEGVYDVSALTLDGSPTDDVSIGPLESAQLTIPVDLTATVAPE